MKKFRFPKLKDYNPTNVRIIRWHCGSCKVSVVRVFFDFERGNTLCAVLAWQGTFTQDADVLHKEYKAARKFYKDKK